MYKKPVLLLMLIFSVSFSVFSDDSDSILTTFPDESEKIDAGTFGKDTTDKIQAESWATSERSCFAKGDKNLSFGLSLYPFGGFVGFSYAVHECFSVGGATGFNFYLPVSNVYNYTVYRVPVAVRGAFHPFNLSVLADKVKIRDRMDIYVGVSTGWKFSWDNYYDDNVSRNALGYARGFYFREYVGMKYYLKDNFYLVVEEDGGISFSAGIGFKF